jgi:hypothetical protein
VGAAPGAVDLSRAAGAWVGRAHPLRDNEWKVDVAVTMVQRSLERSLAEAQAVRSAR